MKTFLKGARGHLRTIMEHHDLVMRYCFRAGLYRQGLLHDLSKLSPTEFIPGAKYYQGDRSPNTKEREEEGISKAWIHHKGRNKHHFEYWLDYGPTPAIGHGFIGGQMPRRYVAEMIFDRVSACRVYQGENYTDKSPYEYFEKGAKSRWYVNETTKRQMDFLLRMWADKGEDYTVRYIRHVFLKGKDKGEKGSLAKNEE